VITTVVAKSGGTGGYRAATPLACDRRRTPFVPDVEAHITGTVWKIECQLGQEVEEGDTLVILESMKMEMPVEAEDDGVVKEIRCAEGQPVSEGETLVVLE
jgi:acetyl-CoA carboxylase biotin carboxyl carrier protein